MKVVFSQEWELLFNSRLHGGSFNTFMGKAAERGGQVLCCAARIWRHHVEESNICLNYKTVKFDSAEIKH